MNPKDDKTRSEVADGLLYTHSRANSNTAKLLEVSSFAYAAMELLAEKGLIDIEVLDRKKKEIADRLVEKFRQEGVGAAYQNPEHDKYTFEGAVKIDCENRVHRSNSPNVVSRKPNGIAVISSEANLLGVISAGHTSNQSICDTPDSSIRTLKGRAGIKRRCITPDLNLSISEACILQRSRTSISAKLAMEQRE